MTRGGETASRQPWEKSAMYISYSYFLIVADHADHNFIRKNPLWDGDYND